MESRQHRDVNGLCYTYKCTVSSFPETRLSDAHNHSFGVSSHHPFKLPFIFSFNPDQYLRNTVTEADSNCQGRYPKFRMPLHVNSLPPRAYQRPSHQELSYADVATTQTISLLRAVTVLQYFLFVDTALRSRVGFRCAHSESRHERHS